MHACGRRYRDLLEEVPLGQCRGEVAEWVVGVHHVKRGVERLGIRGEVLDGRAEKVHADEGVRACVRVGREGGRDCMEMACMHAGDRMGDGLHTQQKRKKMSEKVWEGVGR